MTEAELDTNITNLGFYLKDNRVQVKGKQITIELDPEGVNYDSLSKLAELLGTTNISFATEERNAGWCETCSYYYGIMVLTAVLP